MATRSYIGQISKTETGAEVNYVYCHFDGYPSGVGKMLVDNYKDPSLVSELISLGDMSYLDARIHPVGEHSWDNPERGVSVFYGRDRGEKNTKAKFVTVDGENIAHEQIALALKNLNEYVYVFDTESSKWLIKLGNDFKDLESIGFDESHPVYNVKFKGMKMENELLCESGCDCACEQEQQIPLGLEDFVDLFKDPTNTDNFSKFPEFMDLLFPDNHSAYEAIEDDVNRRNKMHTEFPVQIEILENNGGEGEGDYRNMVCKFTAFDPQGEVFWFPFYVDFHASYSSWDGTHYWSKSDEYQIVYPRLSVSVEYTTDCQFDNKYEMEEFSERLVLSKGKARELSINEQMRLLQKRSNHVSSFERELELIGLGENATEIDLVMRENILEIVDVVSSQGHSGFSFSYLSSIMNKFFSKTPILSPLTGEDSEWTNISDYSDNPTYQNNRMSSVFKHINADGKVECYWLDGTVFYTVETDENGEQFKNYFTNGKSSLSIESFPWYPPETQYVEVPKDHEEI